MTDLKFEIKIIVSKLIKISLILSSFGFTACATNPAKDKASGDDELTIVSAQDVDAMIKEAEAETTEEEVADYTVTDYQGFNPAGIVVHFEFKKATLSPQTVAALDKIVVGMEKDALATITIRGHADKQGEKDYNEKLSLRRAQVIKEYLLSHGIESDRLNPVHLGSADPVDESNRVAAYKKNRRGDFNINYAPSAFGPAK